MAKLTNKQYEDARIEAENASELFEFETWHSNYYGGFYSRYLTSDNLKELREDYKSIKKLNGGFALEGFGNRAIVYPTEHGLILRSYNTEVCEVLLNGDFVKLWNGYSNTTLKHINIFRAFLGMSTLSKREWIELEMV